MWNFNLPRSLSKEETDRVWCLRIAVQDTEAGGLQVQGLSEEQSEVKASLSDPVRLSRNKKHKAGWQYGLVVVYLPSM